MIDDTSPEDGLFKAIALPTLGDSAAEIAEAALDQLLVDSFARDVPILGTVVNTVRTTRAFRDYLFARKVARFLLRLSEVAADERIRFSAGVADPEERRRVGEAVLLFLERLDNMEKPQLLARLFAGYVMGSYDFNSFRRLAEALDKISTSDIQRLRAFYSDSPHGLEPAEMTSLAYSGLAAVVFYPDFAMVGGGFVRTPLGEQFVSAIVSA